MTAVAMKATELTKTFKNCDYLNFSEEPVRQKMLKTLESLPTQFETLYGLRDGAAVSSSSRTILSSVNPSKPSQCIGRVELATSADVEAALKTVHEGAKTWGRTSVEERTRLVDALGAWMFERRYELAAWMVYEVGKTWREADADVAEAIDFCHYYASEMRRLGTPRINQIVQGESNTMSYFPKGIAVVIAPWNFPLAILAGMTVASLVTGNTVIFKPAETSAVIGAKLAQGIAEVGFPKSAFYFLPGVGSEIGPILTGDPRVDLIAFTGSASVGLSIIENAAKKPVPGQRGVKKVICEMGGKNALIIDEDADIDEAIAGALHSAFGFQGQKCSALSRLLVHEAVYDVFVARFIEATKSLRVGEAVNPEFQVGPVIDTKAQQRILSTIEDGSKRMKLLYRAQTLPAEGYFVPPTIFECQTTEEPLFQNEIFGPVVLVKKVKNLDEALRDANSVAYALTGGIYSRSPSHIERAKQEFEVGNLYINRAITGAVVERHPFGGFKMSGIGSKAGGPDYLLQFLEPRSVAENTVRRGFAGC